LQKINQDEFLQPLTQEGINDNLKAIKEGNKAYDIIIAFHDFIYSAIYPNLPLDKEMRMNLLQMAELVLVIYNLF